MVFEAHFLIKMFLIEKKRVKQIIMSIEMYSWIIHVWDIQWIELKVQIGTYEFNKWENKYPKQLVWWISSWLLELL